jgi:cyclophilin family peptidyl-prolyl cis-trans isomerase
MRSFPVVLSWLLLPSALLCAGWLVAQENQEKSPAGGAQSTTPEAPDAASPDAPKSEASNSEASKTDADPPPTTKPSGDSSAAAAAFEAKLTEWKDLIKSLRNIAAKFQTAGDAEKTALRTEWDALIAQGNALIPALRSTGLTAYKASPNTDRELAGFLAKIAEDEAKHDRYDSAMQLAQVLIDNECDRLEIYSTAGVAAFALDNFAAAAEYFKKAQDASAVTDLGNRFAGQVPEYQEHWKLEQAIREKEAADDDLPRVKLTTDAGEIVVELFENEAPQTVGNFISLVEAKFYDGTVFHRVLPNFMAQGGCPDGTGRGGPGYRIPCECYTDDYRKHFRGTLSMAHAGKDTGGSQFFLTFLPTQHLNGRHTAFGRVIEGFDVLEKINRRDPSPDPQTGLPPPESSLPTPSKLIKAEVIRKRDHEYKPTKIE